MTGEDREDLHYHEDHNQDDHDFQHHDHKISFDIFPISSKRGIQLSDDVKVSAGHFATSIHVD